MPADLRPPCAVWLKLFDVMSTLIFCRLRRHNPAFIQCRMREMHVELLEMQLLEAGSTN